MRGGQGKREWEMRGWEVEKRGREEGEEGREEGEEGAVGGRGEEKGWEGGGGKGAVGEGLPPVHSLMYNEI